MASRPGQIHDLDSFVVACQTSGVKVDQTFVTIYCSIRTAMLDSSEVALRRAA